MITTQRQISAQLYTVSFISLLFDNVVYESKGEIIRFGHQLTLPVVVVNLTITQSAYTEDSPSGRINFESYNQLFAALKTLTNIQGFTMDGVYTRSQSLIRTGPGCTLDITQASFTNTQSTYLDSGIFSTEDDSIVTITNGIFQNNSAISASIFKVKDNSQVKCTNCEYSNNFAISYGVFSTVSDGKLELILNSIHNNYALQNSIGEIFSFDKVLTLSTTQIYENEAITQIELESELTSCSKL